MEERRLKNMLSHLSMFPPSHFSNSTFVNAASKPEKVPGSSSISTFPPSHFNNSTVVNAASEPEKVPGSSSTSTHWQQEAYMGHSSIPRSKSSSDILKNRRFCFADGSPVTEFVSSAGPCKGRANMDCGSAADAEHKRALSSLSKENVQDAGYPYGVEVAQVYGLETAEHNQIHCSSSSSSSIHVQYNAGSFGPMMLQDTTKNETLGPEDDSAADSLQTQNWSRPNMYCNKWACKDQNPLPNSSSILYKENCQQHDFNGLQMVPINDAHKMDEARCNSWSCSEKNVPESETIDAGDDMMAGSISRNNVMTGQRRRVVDDCIFCLIIKGQSPSFKLYEDDMCVCILDLHPLSHGHALLIPKAHFPSLELTPPEVAAAMCATVPVLSMAIMKATNCDSFNLLVNSGKAAGQVVFHTHFHIIPRRNGDNLWRSEDGSRRSLPIGHETAILVQNIRRSLSSKHI